MTGLARLTMSRQCRALRTGWLSQLELKMSVIHMGEYSLPSLPAETSVLATICRDPAWDPHQRCLLRLLHAPNRERVLTGPSIFFPGSYGQCSSPTVDPCPIDGAIGFPSGAVFNNTALEEDGDTSNMSNGDDVPAVFNKDGVFGAVKQCAARAQWSAPAHTLCHVCHHRPQRDHITPAISSSIAPWWLRYCCSGRCPEQDREGG